MPTVLHGRFAETSYIGQMKRSAIVAASLVLCAQAASACITVEASPRRRFREAVVIVRATAGQLFVFDAERSWRGGIPRGAEIAADYDPTSCGVPKIEEGEEYILYAYEPPQREGKMWILSRAQFVRMDTAQREIGFLDASGATPLTSHELGNVLGEWKSGRLSHERMRAWLAQVSTRDVDDWRNTPDEGPVSPMNELLDLLSSLLHPVPPTVSSEIAECRADILRTRVDSILKFAQSPQSPFDEFRDALARLEEAIGEEASRLGC